MKIKPHIICNKTKKCCCEQCSRYKDFGEYWHFGNSELEFEKPKIQLIREFPVYNQKRYNRKRRGEDYPKQSLYNRMR